MPDLSIIIPFHDERVLVTVASIVAAASASQCELILVGDGVSLSGFPDNGNAVGSHRVRQILLEKTGRIGYLRNKGILAASTEYFFFIDSDCELHADALSVAIQARREGCVIRGCNVFLGRNALSRLDAQIRDQRYLTSKGFAYCPNLLIHASVFKRLGLFDEDKRYGSDGDYAKKIVDNGIAVSYLPDIIVTHDCTKPTVEVLKSWIRLGEARYARYSGHRVNRPLQVYFPNLFAAHRGAIYNIAVAGCNVARAIGMGRAWMREKIGRTRQRRP